MKKSDADVNAARQAFRLLDGRPSIVRAANLVASVPFETTDKFVDSMVDKILSVRPDWDKDETSVKEAARRYSEFASKHESGDDVFLFRLPTGQNGLLIIRQVGGDPRIVTVMLTQYT
jgi:hypothetical protein